MVLQLTSSISQIYGINDPLDEVITKLGKCSSIKINSQLQNSMKKLQCSKVKCGSNNKLRKKILEIGSVIMSYSENHFNSDELQNFALTAINGYNDTIDKFAELAKQYLEKEINTNAHLNEISNVNKSNSNSTNYQSINKEQISNCNTNNVIINNNLHVYKDC